MASIREQVGDSGGPSTPLSRGEVESQKNELERGWVVLDGRQLERVYLFSGFDVAMRFAQNVGGVAEAEGKEPDLTLSWGSVRLKLWTPEIRGLANEDFKVAKRVDELYDLLR